MQWSKKKKNFTGNNSGQKKIRKTEEEIGRQNQQMAWQEFSCNWSLIPWSDKNIINKKQKKNKIKLKDPLWAEVHKNLGSLKY